MVFTEELEYQKMAQVEQKHWWYRSLHELVLNHLEKNKIDNSKIIIDAGCGTGGLMLFLARYGFNNVSGFDASPYAFSISRQNGLSANLGNLINFHQYYQSRGADALVSNDTLYFLEPEDRLNFLRESAKVLKNGGLLILNLPSQKIFSGLHDRAVGIMHRFSKAEVWDLFTHSEFQIQTIFYWPFILSPLIFLSRLSQRIRIRLSPDLSPKSDIDLPVPVLNRLFYTVVRIENRLLNKKPFGSSLFLVAKKGKKIDDQYRNSYI